MSRHATSWHVRALIARGGRALDALREAVEALTGRGFEVAGPSLATAPKGYALITRRSSCSARGTTRP